MNRLLLIARPLAETRTWHLFVPWELPRAADSVTALCGASYGPGDLELVEDLVAMGGKHRLNDQRRTDLDNAWFDPAIPADRDEWQPEELTEPLPIQVTPCNSCLALSCLAPSPISDTMPGRASGDPSCSGCTGHQTCRTTRCGALVESNQRSNENGQG